MKIRSFAFMYAVRELKMRKKTFIPVICIAAGVMILLTNLLIFAQSEHTTDLAYLKTNTHLIMPNLTLDEADALESFEYVDRIDRVSDGSQYICYVKLKDKYLEGFRIYAETGIRAMEELGVTAKSPYNNYNELHRKYHFDDIFIGCGLYNTRYLRLMKEDPVFNPEFLLLLLFSFLTYFASIWLVFHMKVRRSRDEFASIRAMGASMRDLRTINQIEAVGITVIMYIPILLVSLLTMKIVCVLSENLYPEFALNSLLTFDPPWYMLAVSFIIFVFASYIAVLIVTRHLKTNTINELMRGTDKKIPFIEKSSSKFINSSDFHVYGEIELKRGIKSYLPTQILFCLLILLPMYLVTELQDLVSTIDLSSSTTSIVYSFDSIQSGNQRTFIPRYLAEYLKSLDGVTHLTHQEHTSPLPYETSYSGVPETYQSEGIVLDIRTRSDLFDPVADVPETGTCIAPSEIFDIGDEICLSFQNTSYTLTVSETRDNLLDYRNPKRYSYPWLGSIFISDVTFADIMGYDEPLYRTIQIHCEKGRELELIPLIEATAGYEHSFVNDHERQLRQRAEMNYSGSAVFLEERINDLYNTFLNIFAVAETLYLLICAGSIISSVTAYEVSGRTKEFSILRALGIYSDDLQRMSAKKQLSGIVLTVSLTYVILTISALYIEVSSLNASSGLILAGSTNRGILWSIIDAVIEIIGIFTSFLPISILAFLGFGGCAYLASRKTVSAMLSKPVAEAVKNKE